MSKEDSSGGPQGDSNTGKKDPNADIFENRRSKKLIRLVTVMAYMFSVSFVGIALSAYYLFLWEPPNPRLIRTHMQADPQVQFLLSESSPFFNHSGRHWNELPHDELAQDASRGNSNNSRVSLSGRIGDTSDASSFMDDRNRLMVERRNKVDESLFLLRNSLVEILRGKLNTSDEKSERSEGTEESRESGGFNSTKVDEAGTKTGGVFGYDVEGFSNFSNYVGNENETGWLESSTVSRDANVARLRSEERRGELDREIHRVDRNESLSAGSGNDAASLDYRKNDKSIGRNVGTKEKEIGTVFENSTRIKTPRKSGAVLLEKVSLSNDDNSTEKIARIKGGRKKLKKGMENRERVTNFPPSAETIGDSSRNTKSAGLEFPRRTDASSRLAKTAMNFEETLIEKMTTKSVIVEEKHSGESGATGTQRPKDLLTILMETTSTEIFPSTPSSTSSEDFSTDLIIASKNQGENIV